MAEVNATGEQLFELGGEANQFARRGRGVDARDQEPLAAAGGQQFNRVGDARGAAGQRDDAVGEATKLLLLVRDGAGKQEETGKKDNDRERHNSHEGSDDARAAPAGRSRSRFMHARDPDLVPGSSWRFPPQWYRELRRARDLINCGYAGLN